MRAKPATLESVRTVGQAISPINGAPNIHRTLAPGRTLPLVIEPALRELNVYLWLEDNQEAVASPWTCTAQFCSADSI